MRWKFKLAFSFVILLVLFILPTPDKGKLMEIQAAKVLTGKLDGALGDFLPDEEPTDPISVRLSLVDMHIEAPNGEGLRQALNTRINEWARSSSNSNVMVRLTDQDPDLILRCRFTQESHRFCWAISLDEGGPFAPQPEEEWEFFSTWVAMLPPFLAILAAVLLARTVLGLFLGASLGAWILATQSFFPLLGQIVDAGTFGGKLAGLVELLLAMILALPVALKNLTYDILLQHCLLDEFKWPILGFVVFLCATVGVMARMGGIQGLVDLMRKRATTMRSTQLATYMMGLAIFFDDYANTIVVGSTMRPLTDRFNLAREKLAYIVDSTSAPVAGLSVVSTWIAYEVSTFSSQLPEVGIAQDQGLNIFIETIPFRFYCIFSLVLVFLTIITKREFGPMLGACRRALATGDLVRQEGQPMVSDALTKVAHKTDAPTRPHNALIPILLLVGITVFGIYILGIDPVYSIFLASLISFCVATLLALGQRILSLGETASAAYSASRALWFALAILILAWAIGHVCQELGTATFLVASFTQILRPEVLPMILFGAGCLVSFSTGSSWSTMAILLPNVVVLAFTLGEQSSLGEYGLMILSIGAVLEGSIFGDHCSPISDTTILSSVAAASDHMDHTRTQMPYSLLAMLTALVVGYIPVAFLGRDWVWISIPLGIVVLLAFLLIFGKNPAHQVAGELKE